MSGGEGNSISSNKKEKEIIFFTLSLVSRRMGPFLPHQKKIMGSIPHEFRIFPDGCLCSGDLGMGCPHDQACSPQLPAEWPGQSSLCQVLHVVKTPGTRSRCWLCWCPWPHFSESTRGTPRQGLTGIQDHPPASGSSLGWLESDGGGGGLGHESQLAGK